MSTEIVKAGPTDLEHSASTILDVIERVASNPAADVEKLERLLAIQQTVLADQDVYKRQHLESREADRTDFGVPLAALRDRSLAPRRVASGARHFAPPGERPCVRLRQSLVCSSTPPQSQAAGLDGGGLTGRGAGTNARSPGAGAVSYTHLDVYKRQVPATLDTVVSPSCPSCPREHSRRAAALLELLELLERPQDAPGRVDASPGPTSSPATRSFATRQPGRRTVAPRESGR